MHNAATGQLQGDQQKFENNNAHQQDCTNTSHSFVFSENVDYQYLPAHFAALAQLFTFTGEGFTDVAGHNCLLQHDASTVRCHLQRDFHTTDLAGRCWFLNPPWKLLASMLEHYFACKSTSPQDTSAVFVMPAKAAQQLGMYEKCLHLTTHAAGTVVFTVPAHPGSSERVNAGPCPFDVAVFYDPPAPPHAQNVVELPPITGQQHSQPFSPLVHHTIDPKSRVGVHTNFTASFGQFFDTDPSYPFYSKGVDLNFDRSPLEEFPVSLVVVKFLLLILHLPLVLCMFLKVHPIVLISRS